MDSREAAAVNILLRHLGVRSSREGEGASTDPAQVTQAAALLAEQARAAMPEGIGGDDVRRSWPAGPPAGGLVADSQLFGWGAVRAARRAGLSPQDANEFERAVTTGELRGRHPGEALGPWLTSRNASEPTRGF
jgi:hypothetical protein